jgi:hypothetical protein
MIDANTTSARTFLKRASPPRIDVNTEQHTCLDGEHDRNGTWPDRRSAGRGYAAGDAGLHPLVCLVKESAGHRALHPCIRESWSIAISLPRSVVDRTPVGTTIRSSDRMNAPRTVGRAAISA